MAIYIKNTKGVGFPIVTNNVTVHESLGNLSTISVTFLAVDGDKYNTPKSYVRAQFVNNHPALALIAPFTELIEKGQRYYLQQPQIDDSTDPATVTLTGIQVAKQLHWHYVGKLLHGPTKTFMKTEVIKTRVTEKIPYKDKKGKVKYKKKSNVVKSTKPIKAKKVESKIELYKCLDFIAKYAGKELHFKYAKGSESLKTKKYSYPDGFGKGYADELLKKLSQDFDFEYSWDNLTCTIAKKLGEKDSFYFVDRVNCQKINQEESYTNITTRVTVYSNPEKTRKNKVKSTNKKTAKYKKKSHSSKRPKYKTERTKHNDREKYKRTFTKKVISKTIDGKKVSTKTTDSKSSGVKYKRHYTYVSPLTKEGYPVIDAKTVYLKSSFTLPELKAKAKSLVKDSPSVTYTVTGTNFKKFAKIHGKVAIGNQGYLKRLNGDKVQKARITAIESHPEDDETADQITFGTFRTNPISYQLRQRRELETLRRSYDDLSNDSYDLSSDIDSLLDMFDDHDSMINHLGNWHVKSYKRDLKRQKSIVKINNRLKKLEALQAAAIKRK